VLRSLGEDDSGGKRRKERKGVWLCVLRRMEESIREWEEKGERRKRGEKLERMGISQGPNDLEPPNQLWTLNR